MVSEDIEDDSHNSDNEQISPKFSLNPVSYPRGKHPYSGVDRYYYPRPTPQDILYEEDFFHNKKSYNGRTIYEWNIDGMTEYQIFEVIHQIYMYSTVYKQNNNNDHTIAGWITIGFTRMLKGWWDNSLTEEQRTEILTAVKIEEIPGPQPRPQQDVVYTLTQTIILHFIGPWEDQYERGRELLQNLNCPTLTHFRWYRDVFLAKVM